MALLAIGMGLTSCDEQLDNAVTPVVAEVTSIEVDLSKIDEKYLDTEKTKLQLTVGDEVTLSFTILPEEMASTEVELTVADATILSIDGLKVKALKEGETKVTAKAGDKTATCVVTVTDAPIAIDLSTLTAAYEAQNGDVLTGELSAKVKISIADGATVTLDGITIMGVTGLHEYEWAGINCLGDATIILKDGTENTVKGFNESYPGILIPSGKTLTIKGETKGTGTLSTSSNGEAAGIGGGWFIGCGNINIEGGVITASGGQGAAGIGGGYHASCGDITITTGVTQVTAKEGNDAPNSIGAGNGGSCGTVTIGGVVGAISTSPYTYPVPALNLTSPAVGQVIGDDGKNHDYASLPGGVTAVAKICYVSGSNGLALALADEGQMNWSTAISTCAAHTPAFTGGTWKLATQSEWNNMITAAGSYTALRDGFTSVGGSNLKSNYYWSSTEYENDPDDAWMFYFDYGYWTEDSKGIGYPLVRACLAF